MIDVRDDEQLILGTILSKNALFFEARAAGLKPEEFAVDDHRRQFAAIARLIEDGAERTRSPCETRCTPMAMR